MKQARTNKAKQTLAKLLHAQEDQDLALVREPTDLNLPEEDLIIRGGTGENEHINGVYFKISNTFGLHIYKMARVKKGTWLRGEERFERYLYKDTNGDHKYWVITPKPMGRSMGAACAFIRHDADRPTGIGEEDWSVWHHATKSMMNKQEHQAFSSAFRASSRMNLNAASIQKATRIDEDILDEITLKPIVGFHVSLDADRKTLEHAEFTAAVFLRRAREIYGRPVYETEAGDQLLYWVETGGNLEEGDTFDGVREGELVAAGNTVDLTKLFSRGHWMISNQFTEALDSPFVLAYVQDYAVTPDGIQNGATWSVKVGGTMKSLKVSLRLEESAVDNMLADLDGGDWDE
jgi:hypothetical protein